MGVASSCFGAGFGAGFLHAIKNGRDQGVGASYEQNSQPGISYESHAHEEQVLFFPDQTQLCKDFLHGVRGCLDYETVMST